MRAYKASLRLAAIGMLAAGFGQSAAAATRTTSFGVSATVVATCTLSMAPKAGAGPTASGRICAPQTQGVPNAIVAAEPVLKVTRDSKTGGLIQTIEF